MPPSLPQDSDNIPVKSPEPYYTNEDVAILHDIVVHAQELLPSLPERERVPTNALFHAYHSILPSIGVDIDHDSRYARVLFKIGGIRSDGSLYDRFEAVLSRLGIEIQFDQENNSGDEGATTELGLDQSPDLPAHSRSALAVVDGERGRLRRNSDGPELDHGARHGENVPRHRASSSASTVHSTHGVRRPNTAISPIRPTAKTFEQTLHHTQARDSAQKPQNGYNLGTWLSDSFGSDPQRVGVRTRSASTHGSMRVRRRSPPATKDYITTKSTSHSTAINYTTADPPFPGAGQEMGPLGERLHHQNRFALKSEELLSTKVTLLEQFRKKNSQRQILSRWRRKVLQLREDNENLDVLAKHQDRRVLLRQAFDSWRTAVEEQRRRVIAERFFTHLEGRASRARDLYLLAKAFTHWSYSASIEIQRTSIARRHILRARYFSAWHDTTAINKLKVRQQILSKFFPLWHKQQVTTSLNMERAAPHFTGNLVQRVFWAWFWAFCERRAPAWRAERLLGNQMANWIKVMQQRKEREKVAIDYYDRNVGRKICLAWSIKTSECATRTCKANDYRAIAIYQKILRRWRHELSLMSRLRSLRDKVELRLKRDMICLWLLRARQESHSKAIDRLKIIREAWVTWNDNLRCRAMQAQISDRLILQFLRKWVTSERLVLARRLVESRMMRTSIQNMVQAFRTSTVKKSRDLRSAKESSIRRLGGNVIRLWYHCLQTRLQHQRLAAELSSPSILSGSLALWSSRRREIHQLQTWAHDGEFYFLASKTLERWKDATEKKKKEKRRSIYTQFRRKYKLSLASRLFSRWHQQANSAIRLDRLAFEVYHHKCVEICIETFDQWRTRIQEAAEVDLMRGHFLLKKYFTEMKSRSVGRRDLEMEAMTFFEDRATSLRIKKWSRVYLQARARLHMVFELREKYLKKTSRRILAHWQQRTSRKQDPAGIGSNKTSNFSLMERAVSWTGSRDQNVDEWGDDGDEAAISTPIPRYLSTPSKRMSRVNAMTRFPSTTPSAPLSTPVERQLRAQYSGGVLPSFRGRIGRSLLGRGGTPLDLDGESRIGAGYRTLE